MSEQSYYGITVQAIVVDMDDMVATVEMGPKHEEWVFPLSMLPADVQIDSTLVFEGEGAHAEVIDHRPPAPSVEDRLSRSLNRRRLHLA